MLHTEVWLKKSFIWAEHPYQPIETVHSLHFKFQKRTWFWTHPKPLTCKTIFSTLWVFPPFVRFVKRLTENVLMSPKCLPLIFLIFISILDVKKFQMFPIKHFLALWYCSKFWFYIWWLVLSIYQPIVILNILEVDVWKYCCAISELRSYIRTTLRYTEEVAALAFVAAHYIRISEAFSKHKSTFRVFRTFFFLSFSWAYAKNTAHV